MKIELLKPYAMSNAGEVLNPSPVIAKMLIKRKVAKALRKKKVKK